MLQKVRRQMLRLRAHDGILKSFKFLGKMDQGFKHATREPIACLPEISLS